MSADYDYDPDCYRCRELAGRKPAGVTPSELCLVHTREAATTLRYVLYTDAVKMQREAFVEGAWYGRVVSGPIFDNHVAQRGAEAEAAKRYKEE